MKSLVSLIILAMFSCCGESTEEKFHRECPYKNEYVGAFHQLQVPVNVIPHKLKYQVGDTISFVVDMKESIHDLNTEQNFKIENFPFEPLPILYHFYDGIKWKDGFRSVKYLIDSNNFIKYIDDASRADGILLKMTNSNSNYRLTLSLVLKEKGKYLFHMLDNINDFRSDSEEYKKIKAITFPGKCPTFSFMPCNTIVGDDQLSHFERELLHIDKVEFFDNWRSNKFEYGWQSPFGEGYFTWEYNATFGFEVE